MFVAEFSFQETTELADDLLIQAKSLPEAKKFAEDHARALGLNLFALKPATQEQVFLYCTMHKFICLETAEG